MVSLMTIIGAVALIGGGSTYFTYEPGLKIGLNAMLNLKEGGPVYPLYINPPVTSMAKYYIYEVVNPREFLVGKKLKFRLRGPYICEVRMTRDNITFSEGQKILRYHSHRTLTLKEDLSANLDERFWITSPIFLGVQKTVKEMILDRVPFRRVSEPIVFNSVNILLDNFGERLFIKRSPRDLLEGNKVRILEVLVGVAQRFGLAAFLPPGPPENIFGLVHAQNAMVEDLEIWTGVGDPTKFGDVIRWNGKTKVTQWEGRCSNIEGTNDPVGNAPVTVQDGLQALEYEFSKKLYQGARTNPNNKCFCKNIKTYDCQYDGLISMGPCFFDSPLYFSRPKFLGLDRRIRSLMDEDSIDSIDLPTKQSFWLEPITGTVLKVNLTLTGNFKVVRQPYMRDLAKVQNLTYAPLFTVNEKMVQYYKPVAVLIATSGAGVLLISFLFTRRATKSPSQDSGRTGQVEAS